MNHFWLVQALPQQQIFAEYARPNIYIIMSFGCVQVRWRITMRQKQRQRGRFCRKNTIQHFWSSQCKENWDEHNNTTLSIAAAAAAATTNLNITKQIQSYQNVIARNKLIILNEKKTSIRNAKCSLLGEQTFRTCAFYVWIKSFYRTRTCQNHTSTFCGACGACDIFQTNGIFFQCKDNFGYELFP